MATVEQELRVLVGELRGMLAYEEDLGGPGLPYVAPVVRSGVPAPERIEARPAVVAPERSPTPEFAQAIASPTSAPRLSESEARAQLAVLAEQAASCTTCRLHTSRTKSVFSRGSMLSELVFVGEGPGFNEDQTGQPFVGPAGQLLDKMIHAMGYEPADVYICNVVKCRPPENRTPQTDEANACSPFLIAQLELVRPKVIVALGKCAAENLGVMPEGGRGWRGAWGAYRGIPVMPTYHPAFLLRSPEFKRNVWDDLKIVLESLGRTPRAAAK